MIESAVLLLEDIDTAPLMVLLSRFGLSVEMVARDADIPGSYWGAPEAGLIKNMLYVRSDTPVHSALHEASHWICMDAQRRAKLNTEAGGTVLEECAVNYMQILLAEQLNNVGRERMLDDMDAWGYSYREGKVRDWLKGDAVDAKTWLIAHGWLADNALIIKHV